MKKYKLISIGLVICVIMAAFAIVPGTIAENAYAQEAEELPAYNYDNVAGFVELPVPMLFSSRSIMPVNDNAVSDSATSGSSGLEMNKKVTKTDDGYTLTLEAYTTGTVTAGTAKPSDIILVLDLSTSMTNQFSGRGYKEVYTSELDKSKTYYVGSRKTQVKWCEECASWTENGCYGGRYHDVTKYTPKESPNDSTNSQFYIYQSSATRLEAMKQAANTFIGIVADEETEDRIAIVGFGDEAYYLSGNGTAAGAFLDATDSETTLLDTISGIGSNDLEYATEHGKGLAYAVNIFNAQSDGTYSDRNKVVIVLTDGEPAPLNTGNWSSRTVKQAIDNSKSLKDGGSSVYTISVMPNTNASNPISDMDKYMDYISSNYPDATFNGNSIDDETNDGDSYYSGSSSDIIAKIIPGTKIDTTNGSYYLTAGDISTLESIFGQIADQTGTPDIELGTTAVIKDIISDSFALAPVAEGDEIGSNITVEVKDAVYTNGVLGWTTSTSNDPDPTVTVSEDKTTVDVTGFDFDKNFVASTGRVEGDISQAGDFHGRKVVITIPIVVKDGFWGGNDVYTNGADSGIYIGDPDLDPVETFDRPTVNIELAVPKITANDKNIYLLGSVPSPGDIMSYSIPAEDAWKSAYVDISETALNKTISNTEDTTDITATITVTPKTDGSTTTVGTAQKAATETGTANVYVFKPVITFNDSTINLGDSADYDVDNGGSVVWKHGNTTAVPANMTGDAPALVYDYTPAEDAFKVDTNVKVSVSIGGTDVTSHVTFYREACTFDGCDWKEHKVVTGSKPNFVVHINNFDLKITKAGILVDHENQSCIFKVKGPNDFEMDVVLVGNDTVTIKNVPAGTYTITEQNDWTWRYEDLESKTVGTADVKDGAATVLFTNSPLTTYWLSGDNFANNLFKAGGEAKFGIDVTAQNGAD